MIKKAFHPIIGYGRYFSSMKHLEIFNWNAKEMYNQLSWVVLGSQIEYFQCIRSRLLRMHSYIHPSCTKLLIYGPLHSDFDM